jgi:hypothetical protein
MIKRLGGWSGAAVVGLAVCTAGSVWCADVELGRARYADRVRTGRVAYVESVARQWDHRAIVANNVLFLLILVTGALFITWHYRLLRKLERICSEPLRHSPGWAIGGWFVPLLNLIRPKQMINDTWRSASPPAPARRIPVSFHLWWVLWVLSSVITAVAGQMPGATVDEISTRGRLATAGDLFSVGAAVLAMVVVISLDRRVALVPEPIPLAAMPGMMLFNPPPGWPAQPPGWQPPDGWRPDPSWPPAPSGWTFWVPRHERWLAQLDVPPEAQKRGGSK